MNVLRKEREEEKALLLCLRRRCRKERSPLCPSDSLFVFNNRKKIKLLLVVVFLTFFFQAVRGQTVEKVGYINSYQTNTKSGGKTNNEYRIMFWNVENLFDTYNDTITDDDEYTPIGEKHWTKKRYQKKLNDIYKTLVSMRIKEKEELELPVIVGMAEVENEKVLADLCKGTPLRKMGYRYIHYDSPDKRGIDVAILYRSGEFRPLYSESIKVSNEEKNFYTRDILLVEGILGEKDSVVLIVNHFPSKRGGIVAERNRIEVAKKLKYTMDTVLRSHPNAVIVVIGDFNCTPEDRAMKEIISEGKGDFVNLMEKMEAGRGSYKYKGVWSYLDQIIVSKNILSNNKGEKNKLYIKGGAKIYMAPFLIEEDKKDNDKKVNRTYLGVKYKGGVSDHLPIYIDLEREEKK